jgi:hypothetical protein
MESNRILIFIPNCCSGRHSLSSMTGCRIGIPVSGLQQGKRYYSLTDYVLLQWEGYRHGRSAPTVTTNSVVVLSNFPSAGSCDAVRVRGCPHAIAIRWFSQPTI